MITTLLNTIRNIAYVPLPEETKLRNMVVEHSLKKGDIFIREGTTPQKFGFVTKGLFRYYYVNEKGSEFTKGFFPELNFIAAYTAMTRNRPSYYTIEAMEDSHVVVFGYDDWKKLCSGHSCWTHILLAMVEKGFMKKEARERELLLFNAEERYRSFLNEYPQLETRIKQHLIASYLGITPVALSRIRKGMGAL